DEQVEELRRRQDAAAQEHSLLCQQRRELQEQWRQESLGDRPGEEPSFTAAAGPEGAEKPPESAVSDEVSPDRRHVESLADAESVEVCEQRGDRREELSAASSELVEDEAFPGHRLAQTTELIGATVGTETRRVPEEAAETASRTAPRRLGARVVRIGALALLVGCGVGAVYLASTPEDIMVKGRVTLNSGAAAHLSAAEHSERMQDPAVFGKAAAISGADIQSMYRSGKIGLAVAAGGYELELNARVPRDQQSVAQACLDAWAKAYQEVLSQSVISGSERKARLAGMETDYQKLVAERRTAQAKLEELKAALQNDPSLGQVEAARAAKSELKTRLARARDEWEAAKAKLAAFEATAPSTDTIVPTEEQLVQACAGDGELMQAVEQRDAKARELHKVLTEAMSQSQTPLAALLASINELASEVDQQIADQTDKDIRRELEEIAVTLKDYRRYAEVFSRNWDELAPKVGSWKAGGDADLLLEYQKKAEMLIREFHSQSGESSKTAGAKTDAIAQGGSEMTMRRVIHGRLRKALLACQQARNDWILAARGAVPRYNLGLKALEDAIHDLTPRIEQRRKYHKDKLVEQLMKARGDERAAESQRLLENREEATRQYQRLSDEFVKLDTEATGDEAARAEAQQKQIQIREQEERISRLDREAQAIQQEIDRLQGDGDVSLAGSASYEQLAASPPDRLESRRLHQGLKLGGVSTAVSFIVFFAISGLRRPRH
ncbi:MAG TPA: hypothetical protein VMV94_05150, partial [Phycisphaerae bacterium]|nr:hypothetical protein [Phycisphaerae bacterium]